MSGNQNLEQQKQRPLSDTSQVAPLGSASTSRFEQDTSVAFQSRLSAHNINKNAPTSSRKAGKNYSKPVADSAINSQIFTNSKLIDEVTTKCDELTLANNVDSSSRQKNKQARKKHQKREIALQLPQNVPNLNFSFNNPTIRDYFANYVCPMYSGSSVQYLENLAHHPQFQYQSQIRAPHSAPALPTSNQMPPVQPAFTAPVFNTSMYNPPAFLPQNTHNQHFPQMNSNHQPIVSSNAFNGMQQHVQYLQSQQFQQNRNNCSSVQIPAMNGIQQNSQYYQNLQQHPLLRATVQPHQESHGPSKQPTQAQQQKHCRKKTRSKNNRHQFDSYLSVKEVENGLKNNTLLQGVLRINPKQYSHAYITTSSEEQDIFIDGLKRRNRALEGDLVVIQLIEKENKDSSKDMDDSEDDGDVAESKEDKEDAKLDDNKEEVRNNSRGKVVFIKEKVHPRTCTGHLKLMPDKNHTRALFIPRDYRIPRLNIPCTSWPDNFHKQAKSYENVIFLAKITDWNDDRFAVGTILRSIGQAGDLHTETQAILSENNLDGTPYGPEVKSFFPGPDFVIPEEEILKREDCRKMCIFSIDPATCRDVDDALSCRLLENGNYEIGVHISDVSHFLKENTRLDERVAEKATTIYMVEKAFHMLPEELCMLCSLFSGVDKLAFSVFWEITEDAEVLSSRFARTVIHSCAQLAYEHAMAILEDGEVKDMPDIHNGFAFEDIQGVVKVLGKLSAVMRRRRFEGGAMRIDQPKLSFCLNPENSLPESFVIHESKPSHQLIEEFMLLANMTVAKRIYEDHPSLAFLRNHPEPSKFQLNDLVKQLKALDINLDITSAGSLYRSLLPHIGPDCENQQKAIVLSMMCTKPMNRALYFCAHGREDHEFRHYALNVPLYTHFTSPIRRYPDIIVHRLLSASMQYTDMPTWEVDRVRWLAANCNAQKYNAKRAQEKSTELYTLKYIEKNAPVKMEAVVVDVKERFFDVIVIAMCLNRRIYVENIHNISSEYQRSKSGNKLSKLEITWPATATTTEVKLTVELFSVIQVEMVKGDDILKVETRLLRPL